MARKLKTYQTSMGFFDLAVAVPSMKAALEAWGTKSNLFHQGLAAEADDSNVIAATMAKPGVVLKRPVGSAGAFKENATLPSSLSPENKHRKRLGKKARSSKAAEIDPKTARAAAKAYERDQRERDRNREREALERGRRAASIKKAEEALAAAKQDYEVRASKIELERSAVEKRARIEDTRWEKLSDKLKDAIIQARRRK